MTAPIRNVSDTALWVAMYRAAESERDDALFHDPFARRLAGARGAEIVQSVGRSIDTGSWIAAKSRLTQWADSRAQGWSSLRGVSKQWFEVFNI